MSSSVDLFPPRRPLFFPVVIATVFLTILGMTGGYLLRERNQPARTGAQGPSQPVSTPSSAVSSSKPAISGTPCPPQTLALARSQGFSPLLHQVFHAKYADHNEVWICADESNNLFYQAKTGTEPWDDSKNALFLPYVPPAIGTTYTATATNNGTVFTVSPQMLTIRKSNGDVQKHAAVKDGTN